MPRKQAARMPALAVSVAAHIDFGRNILKGISAYCGRCGLQIHLISDTGLVASAQTIKGNRLPPLAGIVAHISSPEEFAVLRALSPHVVGTSNRAATDAGPRVINDEAEIGRMGADYLISLGLRKLVFLNRVGMRYSNERAAAFLRTAQAAGVAVDVIDFNSTHTLGTVGESLLRRRGPLGLMAESDYTARAFVERLPDHRKTVPHRIAVLGVDDDSLQNALAPVSLSSIRTGGYEIGFRAAELALQLHRGEPAPDEALRIRPIRIVECASTNVLAIDDPVVVKAMCLIRDRIGEFRSVGTIVEAVGVNRRSLEMRFRKALNRSIASEMTEARLRNARSLLESTDLSIAEIAELVGYPEYRLLTLAFRRLTGEPPSAYRKRAQGG